MEYIGGGVDYNSGPYTVQFNVGVTRVSFNISVNNDNILESNETFGLSVDKPSLPNRVTASTPDQATVIVLANDGKYRVRDDNHFW